MTLKKGFVSVSTETPMVPLAAWDFAGPSSARGPQPTNAAKRNSGQASRRMVFSLDVGQRSGLGRLTYHVKRSTQIGKCRGMWHRMDVAKSRGETAQSAFGPVHGACRAAV